MKKLIKLFVPAALIFFAVSAGCFGEEDIKVKMNGKYMNFDAPPKIINDRTLVPMRAIFEALGAKVDWEDETQTATGKTENVSVSIKINDNSIIKNGIKKELDVPAQLISDRTMVPIRAISEAFGCSVSWNENENTVIINSETVAEEKNNFNNENKPENPKKENNSDLTFEKFDLKKDDEGFYTVLKKDGTPLITGKFEKADFIGGLIVTSTPAAKETAVYKTDGEFIILIDFSSYEEKNGLLKCFEKDGHQIFINSQGEIFENAENHGELSIARLYYKEGYYNINGTKIHKKNTGSEEKQKWVLKFNNTKGFYQYVLLNLNGDIVSKKTYDEIKFSDGLYFSALNAYTEVIKSNGETLISDNFTKVSKKENIILASKEKGGIFVYDLNGNKLNEEGFFSVGEFSEGFSAVSKNIDNKKKWAYMDTYGKFITDFIYDDTSKFSGGKAKVKLNGKYITIDVNGNITE